MRKFMRDEITIYNVDISDLYDEWEPPVVIISDGGYGISKFLGDPPKSEHRAREFLEKA